MAFLPQFVVPSSHYSIWMQMVLLGFIFNCSGTIVNVLAACFFGAAKKWLSANPLTLKIQQKISGVVLIGLGLSLATLEKS